MAENSKSIIMRIFSFRQHRLAEVLRLKGWILILRGHPDVAAATSRKAISVASDQAAKSCELRAATTLARLLASREHRTDALALLAPMYDWFTEGRETRDLKEAGQLRATPPSLQSRPGRECVTY
jgi:hypothetical protein